MGVQCHLVVEYAQLINIKSMYAYHTGKNKEYNHYKNKKWGKRLGRLLHGANHFSCPGISGNHPSAAHIS